MNSLDSVTRREKRHTDAMRKRKPKRQGSRDQTGKRVPHQYPRTRKPVRNITCKLTGCVSGARHKEEWKRWLTFPYPKT